MKRFLVLVVLVAAIGIAVIAVVRPSVLRRGVVEVRERVGLVEPSTKLEKQRLIVQEQSDVLNSRMKNIAADMVYSEIFHKQVESMVEELNTKRNLSDEDSLLLAKAQLFLRYEEGNNRLTALLGKIDHSISLARLGQIAEEQVETAALEREVETEVEYIKQIVTTPESAVLDIEPTAPPAAPPTATSEYSSGNMK